MSKNGNYLAEHLMGYQRPGRGDVYGGENVWRDGDEWLTWIPLMNDAQAQMVVREVAKLGDGYKYTWEITTWARPRNGEVVYQVILYRVGKAVYNSHCVTNRNTHIVAAAIAALDSLEPKPHECDKMPCMTQWVEDEQRGGYKLVGLVIGMVLGHRAAHYCSFCGKPLGGER